MLENTEYENSRNETNIFCSVLLKEERDLRREPGGR